MQESVQGQRNGDIDLGDQRVALLHQEYQQRKSLCKASDLLSSKDHLMARLQKLLDRLHVDVPLRNEFPAFWEFPGILENS